MINKKGILLVSFGTSHRDTAQRTLYGIEAEIREAYPDMPVYHAWTSGIIRNKLLCRDGIAIPSVAGALEKMSADGSEEVFVQPTFLLSGIEYDRMQAEIAQHRKRFRLVRIGDTLLASRQSQEEMLRILTAAYPLQPGELLILMGHGTSHEANAVYARLNALLRQRGDTAFIGTVEGSPDFSDVLSLVREKRPSRILLAPFLIVAGDHAKNDMAGEEEDSWKRMLQAEGVEVTCVLKGLGELPGVRSLVREHLAEIMGE